jgi:indolepyruvate ferredoxin oxidoreductase, alpha subunit
MAKMAKKEEKALGLDADKPGKTLLLMGTEAVARGALEAGAGVATAYPGTPSSELVDRLAKVAEKFNMYVEWSVNEKVALEIAGAASFAGVRAITAMKQNGLNVVLDFLSGLAYTGINKGLVLMLGDDAGGISSSNEQDSRHIARMLDLPLLEPATFQEAKDMTRWAFELSERFLTPCVLRSVTRILHARGNVTLGELPGTTPRAAFDTGKTYAPAMGFIPKIHADIHKNLEKIREVNETSPFNWYTGPQKPELLVITAGTGWFYTTEAIELLSARKRVGNTEAGHNLAAPQQTYRQTYAPGRKDPHCRGSRRLPGGEHQGVCPRSHTRQGLDDPGQADGPSRPLWRKQSRYSDQGAFAGPRDKISSKKTVVSEDEH